MDNYWRHFLQVNHLPLSYIEQADTVFSTLVDEILVKHKNRSIRNLENTSLPVFIGINGCQGSGKSTLANYLVTLLRRKFQLKALSFSLDDFYYAKNKRSELAKKVHPLLTTRGVPGTHDIDKLKNVLIALEKGSKCVIPRFDKATDNPKAYCDFEHINTAVDIVIVEGWCWGAPPQKKQQLECAINLLEKAQDPLVIWRNYINDQIKQYYQCLYKKMDIWVMLKAPSFDSVYRWRLEQENKLKQEYKKDDPANSSIMSEAQVLTFIQYFQRITEHCLETLPEKVDFAYQLDGNRNIIND